MISNTDSPHARALYRCGLVLAFGLVLGLLGGYQSALALPGDGVLLKGSAASLDSPIVRAGSNKNKNWNKNWGRNNWNRNYVRSWKHRDYYGQFFGGIVLGSILSAAAVGIAPPPPRPDLCWYWADPYMYRGYWDYCY